MKNFVILAAASAFVASPAQSQDASQTQIIAGIKKIGAAWTTIAQNQERIVVQCGQGGFMALRPQRGMQVSFDLKKTESLLNPLVGIVLLSGAFETTSSPEDGRCQASPEAARAFSSFRGNQMRYQMALTYKVQGDKLMLDEMNEVAANQFGKSVARAAPGVNPDWQTALVVKL